MTKSKVIELLPTLSYEELMFALASKLITEGWPENGKDTLLELSMHMEDGLSTLPPKELAAMVERVNATLATL